MNLLKYTKYLKQKIKFYDKLVSCNKHLYMKNPFKFDVNSTTIIWVEDDENA